MALTRKGSQVVELGAGGLEKRKCISQWGGDREDPPVGGEAEERRPHGHRHRELVLTIKKIIEPWSNRRVVWRVVAVCGEHDVDVE